jgi:hypothetical protein
MYYMGLECVTISSRLSPRSLSGAATSTLASDGRLTISVRIQIKRRGGRKVVTLPGGEAGVSRPWNGERTPLQLALARGRHWLAMLEWGEVKSLREIARKEGGRQQLCEPDGEPDYAGPGHRGVDLRHDRRYTGTDG